MMILFSHGRLIRNSHSKAVRNLRQTSPKNLRRKRLSIEILCRSTSRCILAIGEISADNRQDCKNVKAFADATRYIVDNKPGTLRPLAQLLNTSDNEVIDFAYDYLHANSEATLYRPAEALENLIKMSGYMDKKPQSISAKQVIDLSVLNEVGTNQNERVHR